MSDDVWYFAYGSNMDIERLYHARLKPRGVPVTERRLGRLDGWELLFNKTWHKFSGGGAANIRRAVGAVTYGTLNRMPPAGLDVLDHYEGVAAGHYERRALTVFDCVAGCDVEAIAYVGMTELVASLLPPRFYLDHLLAGRDLLPADYAAWLAAHPTLPVMAEA